MNTIVTRRQKPSKVGKYVNSLLSQNGIVLEWDGMVFRQNHWNWFEGVSIFVTCKNSHEGILKSHIIADQDKKFLTNTNIGWTFIEMTSEYFCVSLYAIPEVNTPTIAKTVIDVVNEYYLLKMAE